MVVNLRVVAQRRFELSSRGEAGLVDDLADAAVESLDHAVSLRVTRRNEAMLDLEFFAKDAKHMLAAGYALAVGIFFLAGKSVCKLTAIIGEQLDDLVWAGCLYLGQKVDTAALCLVGIDVHVDPAGCAVNRDEQITPRCFVRHLR